MIPQKRLKKNSFCQENEALNKNCRLTLQDLSNYPGFTKYAYAFNGHFHYAFLKVFFCNLGFLTMSVCPCAKPPCLIFAKEKAHLQS